MTKAAFLPSARQRVGVVDLEWPVEVDGVAYHAVHLARLTAGEVEAAVREAQTKPETERFRLPVFRDEYGAPLAQSVLDALDDDDMLRLDEAATDFFPRRFRADRADDSAR